jgi:hypothetical protein
MANYTFLLGSGVSLQSGVQSVGEITDALFGHNYWEHTDQSIIRGEHPSEYLREHYDVSPIQDFLKLIKERADRYYSQRLEFIDQANYEDLFELVEQINQETKVSRDNPAIEYFCKEIEKDSFLIRKNYRNFNGVIDLGNFTYKTLGFIETVIKYGLNERELNGLDVLDQLMGTGQILNLFTLNHDLLLEKLCDSNEIDYSDGFTEPDGDVRWYEPAVWDNDAQVKIYKLHGSRNWNLIRHTEKGQTHAILIGRDKWHNKVEKGETVDLLLDKGHILTGQRKSEKYYSGIHGEIHYRFSHHLRTCRNLIVSGYGWNDVQMNWKLFDWLNRYEDAKMTIIHAEPENMAKYSRYLQYVDIDRFEKAGKLVLIKKWFQDVEFEDIEKYNDDA